MIDIRAIQPDDYPFLWKMLYVAIYSPERRLPPSVVYEPPIAKYAASFGRVGDHGFVLLTDGKLAGAAWSRLFQEADQGFGFVDASTPELSIAIDAAHRGQGYGQQLLNRLIGELQQAGYAQLSLSVDRRNQAITLYRRAGFHAVSEVGNAVKMLLTMD